MMKLSKTYLLFILSIFILTACQKDEGQGASQKLLTGFRLSLKERFAKGDTIPHDWSRLEMALPDKLPGFKPQSAKGGTFSPGPARFSYVSRFFTDANGKYVFIKVSDYAADSTAFSFWVKQRPQGDRMWRENQVIWMEEEENKEIYRSQAIRGSRYQLHLATNHPRGTSLFKAAIERMKWEKLEP